MDSPEDTSSLLIASSSTVDAVKLYINRDVASDGVKVGSSSKAFKVPFSLVPQMEDILKPLRTKSDKFVRAIIAGDQATIQSICSDYKANVGIIFDEDWNLSDSYKDFAKLEALKCADDALAFKLNEVPFIPDKYIKKEKDYRSTVVDPLGE